MNKTTRGATKIVEILDFIRENKGACTAFAVIALVCLFGTWFCHDYFRNEPIHSDTDSTMVRMEERIDGLERRLDSVSARIDKAQEAVNGISTAVTAGRENAEVIAGGIDSLEKRIDACVQRGGRLANLAEEIERANRERAESTAAPALAK